MRKNIFLIASAMFLLVGCGAQNTEINNNYLSEIETNYSDYIKIGEYKHIVEVESADITDEYIDEMLNSYLEVYSETDTEKKKGTIEAGQKVNVSYVSNIDGEEEPVDNINIYIGHDEIAPGVDEWLIGKETGYIGDTEVTYPKDYADETKAGKNATIKVTINYIVGEPLYTEINDDFIKELTNGEYDNVEVCRSEMKKSVSDNLRYNGGYQAINEISENAEVKKDISSFVDSEFASVKEDYQRYYDYMKEIDSEMTSTIWEVYGYSTEAEYDSYLKELSNEYIKQKLVVYALAKEINVEITEEDENEYKEQMLQYYSQEEIDILYTDETLKYMALQDAVIMKLYDFQDIATE